MSDPLYLAAKMMLYHWRVMEPFEDKKRSAIFNEHLAGLVNAIEAYENINCIVSPTRHPIGKVMNYAEGRYENLDEWAGK